MHRKTDFIVHYSLYTCFVSPTRFNELSLWEGRLGSIKLDVHPFFNWSACTKPGKRAVVYLCVRVINVASFYDFTIGFWSCSDSFSAVQTVLELFRQLLSCSDSFGTVQTVLELFRQFWSGSDSFGTVQTVFQLFRHFWSCSDSLVFFVFHFICVMCTRLYTLHSSCLYIRELTIDTHY